MVIQPLNAHIAVRAMCGPRRPHHIACMAVFQFDTLATEDDHFILPHELTLDVPHCVQFGREDAWVHSNYKPGQDQVWHLSQNDTQAQGYVVFALTSQTTYHNVD